MSRTVFISGATSGVGLITAKRLFADGWAVYAGGMQGDNFGALDYGITQLPFDISDEEGVAGAIKLLSIEVDHLDAIVNNAGIQIPGTLEALSMAAIRRQFDVNALGHLQVIKGMLPLLRKSNAARIVNVSSLMGKVALPMLGAYSMSKFALEAMSDVLRMELRQFGIHVSVIEPGVIDTPMLTTAREDLDALRKESPPEIQEMYGRYFDALAETLEQQAKNAIPPEAVADKIITALTTEKPKPRYTVGFDVVALRTIRNLAPDSVGDWILMRALGIN